VSTPALGRRMNDPLEVNSLCGSELARECSLPVGELGADQLHSPAS
jgi:hypothetical protein